MEDARKNGVKTGISPEYEFLISELHHFERDNPYLHSQIKNLTSRIGQRKIDSKSVRSFYFHLNQLKINPRRSVDWFYHWEKLLAS